MKINVLGHEYKLLVFKEDELPDDLKAKSENSSGLCENFSEELIVIKHNEEPNNYRNLNKMEQKVGRHELFHAYFYKSGIHQLFTTEAQEAIVDMLAINIENIYTNCTKINEFIKDIE